MNPELYSSLFSKLLAAGARDVYLTNIIMKKNRPGNLLSVLCETAEVSDLVGIIFKETTTFGVRHYPVERDTLKRELITVETGYGAIQVKIGFLDGKMIKYAPEYEDCRLAAEKTGQSVLEVYNAVMGELKNSKKLFN